MRRFFATFLLLFGIFASAKIPPYETIQKMPTSIEKDYFIWRYLTQPHCSIDEAKQLIGQVTRVNKKLFDAYLDKTGTPSPIVNNPERAIAKASKESWKKRQKAQRLFYTALGHLKQRDVATALPYLEAARRFYEKKEEVDKIHFWLYMATKEQRYFDALLKSDHANIYTLIAHDVKGDAYPKTLTFTFAKEKTLGFDPTDPMHWSVLKSKLDSVSNLKALADHFASKECIGVYTYIKERIDGQNYFPMPYRNILSKLPIRRQALIYAIARQESRFIPSAISRSFALGLMQFMPFLIDHVAKQKGERIDYEVIFDPKKAIEYASFHLDYLEKYLYHPLFIAYAYNGGIGFTKRHLLYSGNFKKGPYEPYMSLEMMENAEPREYGKKVLTNYVIYMNKLGRPTRLLPLLLELTDSTKTDAFRK